MRCAWRVCTLVATLAYWPHDASERLERPLPRLRGRDREGAQHEDCCGLASIAKIHATHAPTPTLPRKRGRERTASAARSTHSSQDDAASHRALVSRTSAASALARAERDPGPSARIAKRNIPNQCAARRVAPGSRLFARIRALRPGHENRSRKLKSSHRPAPPPATKPRRRRSAAATAAPAPRAAPGHRSASTSRRRS